MSSPGCDKHCWCLKLHQKPQLRFQHTPKKHVGQFISIKKPQRAISTRSDDYIQAGFAGVHVSDTHNKWAGDPSPRPDVSFHATNDKLKVRRCLAVAIKPATVGKHQDFTAIPLKAISAWDAKED